jgi:hypothetical protein
MAAPKENSFWKVRLKSGRDKIFSSPQHLWDAAIQYFQWCDNNPWYRKEAVKGGDLAGKLISVPTQRPYTLSGLCLYLDVTRETFDNYGKEESYKDFFDIVTRIRETIYTQKFEGAAVGAYNANIIIRDLGLREKTELSTDPDRPVFGNIDYSKLPTESLQAILAARINANEP